jgi:predicted GH43/DUF377 family glycosyl hydrolase
MMDFVWHKKGMIFTPNVKIGWMKSHAMVPTAEVVDGNLYKIYFGSRSSKNPSHIGYFIIDLKMLKILEVSPSPLLFPGKLGAFDDNGVLPSSILETKDFKYMYYIGFKPGGTTRMDLFGGLAIFKDEKTLEKYSEAPILDRCKVNPYINTAPFVIHNKSEGLYKYFMYYVAGCGWMNKDLPRYNIQMAFSNDGINWKRDGHICIDFKSDKEVALARPYVVWIHGKYHMWFSYKGEAYHIGYAVSENGIHWTRSDDTGGLSISKEMEAFDSEMVAYGCIVPHKGKYYMFYNGNNYGCGGIGLAIANE